MFSLIQPRESSAGDISPSPSSSMTSNARFKVKMVNSSGALRFSDVSGNNATREDVRQALASAATVAKSVGSVAGNVSDYARKNATRDDFNDVVRKLGKLIDKGLDQFD